jgi:hypothetical protein
MNACVPARRLGLILLSMTTFYSLGLFGPAVQTASAADPPQLFFDTQIMSMSFSGTATLPLGQSWSPIDTTISMTKAQDHNSSRSNRTASISPGDPDNPDPVDPQRLHGTSYQLESFFDVFFEFEFSSPLLSPGYGGGGGTLIVENDAAARLELPSPSPYSFDATALDFGMLSSSASTNRALAHNGHVTVLKIALGGDEDVDGLMDELSIAPDGIVLTAIPGTDNYVMTFDGLVAHTFSATLSVQGEIGDANNSIPFSFGPLAGTITEVGQLSNAIVPEPTSGFLLVIGAMLGGARRCWK